MCPGDNSASHVANYLNAQLSALYENSVECVHRHSNGRKPDDCHKYSFALAEFYFGKHRNKGLATKDDMMFYASFGKPEIEFICNHDALIRLRLHSGHYNLQHTTAAPCSIANTEYNRSFDNLEVSFRIGFNLKSILGDDSKITQGNHLIQVIVLALSNAKFVSSNPDLTASQDALAFYLSKYLEFLQEAGNHILFSIPNFDDSHKLSFDYSLIGNLHTVDEVHGIAVEKINAYLSTLWLKAAMLTGGPDGPPVDTRAVCLAEYHSTWVSRLDGSAHFHVKMGAPHIKALCPSEVVLYFNIDEVTFYDSHDFVLAQARQRYNNWQIAVIVNVIHETIEEGQVIRCLLDLSTARLHQRLSSFFEYDETDEVAAFYWSQLVDFFASEYLDIIESAQYHIIYRYDASVLAAELGIEEETDVTKRPKWSEIVSKTEMHGFDQVITVSQASLNSHFRALWLKANSVNGSYSEILNKWHYNEYISATFKPVTLRLLSNNKAIVWFHLEEGRLRTLNSHWQPCFEGEEHHFYEWSLAFEVDIKICEEEELRTAATRMTSLGDLFAFKHHENHHDRALKHIYLDLCSAEFLLDYSNFDGLFTGNSSRPVEEVRAAVHYIKEYYFSHLTEMGLNVLYTIPVWKAHSTLPPFALTDVAFHIYSKVELTRKNWAHIPESLEPVIAIVGMTDFHPLPARYLQYSTYWVARVNSGASYGTVGIARRTFMEERLLDLLTRVNAETTIVPVFSGVENGTWKLELETWAENRHRKAHACKWTLVEKTCDVILYKWEHRDGWSYEHEGSSGITNGAYSVSCVTQNFVEIPTVYKVGTLQVKIWGDVKLEMSFKTLKEKWSAKSAAKWDSSIAWFTEAGGLRVAVTGSSVPIFERTEIEGEGASSLFVDPRALLQKSLPPTIYLDEVVQTFRTFEGIWSYCYLGLGTESYALASPAFNVNGDLLFELRPHEHYHVIQNTPSVRSRQLSIMSSRPGLSESTFVSRASSISGRIVGLAHSASSSDLVSYNGNNHDHDSDHSEHDTHTHTHIHVHEHEIHEHNVHTPNRELRPLGSPIISKEIIRKTVSQSGLSNGTRSLSGSIRGHGSPVVTSKEIIRRGGELESVKRLQITDLKPLATVIQHGGCNHAGCTSCKPASPRRRV